MMNSGFLLIDKESGLTSQSVDNKIKKKFNIKKVGHLGTLDPLATGLLVVATKESTRYFKYFDESRKTYILSLRIGASSPSLDNETEINNTVDVDLRGKEEYIKEALSSFNKEYNQYPPIYSAVKVDGVPLYKYAYNNKEVEINPKLVEIYDIKLLGNIEYRNSNSYMDILLDVSKGFYVRSFARDFSNMLGYPGMAESIRRTKVSFFSIDKAKKIEDISESDYINPLDYLPFKRVEIKESSYKYILNGSKYIPSDKSINDEYIVLTFNNENIAIYKKDELASQYRMDLLIKNESIIH